MTAAPQLLATPARALSIGAHPDDAEFGAGRHPGAVVGFRLRGHDAGGHRRFQRTWDPALTPEQLVAARHAEQRAAADELGASEVVMLGAVDGELEPWSTRAASSPAGSAGSVPTWC